MFNFRSGRTLFALAVALMRGVMIEMKARTISMHAGRPNLPPSAWTQRPSRVKRPRSAVSLRRRARKAAARRQAQKRVKARKRA